MKSKIRCPWVGTDPLMIKYHDEEWGRVVKDSKKLFEFLTLESAQAGLSWRTILNKREAYRKAFANFDPNKISKFKEKDVKKLLLNPGIVRNKLKIEAAINNAQRFLDIEKEFGSFYKYSMQFVKNKRIVNKFKNLKDYHNTSPEALLFAKDLKKRGFKFLGPTTLYAHMQASGMVDDHVLGCFRKRV